MAGEKLRNLIFLSAFLAALTLPALVGALPQSRDKAILTISGAIEVKNSEEGFVFDRPLLESLGMHTLRTSTNWTTGVRTFEGVLVRDLLRRVGAKGTSAIATALNDYSAEIPLSDFDKFDVLLALRMDGRDLLRRDKGPIWIVYPRDHSPELQDARYDHRWVWQLDSLKIR
ncbi:molybdopterin-dependent oxidoreductase [Microvirga roseola]|uniref:molybdopterin-dependent oxidoreductase n=1 Tax=Microvirga roseola TaxID=2883126 RepID=UPI001E5221DB|nr:molybdopterin-dependent oxidoreductase [Microvirga roseola]